MNKIFKKKVNLLKALVAHDKKALTFAILNFVFCNISEVCFRIRLDKVSIISKHFRN